MSDAEIDKAVREAAEFEAQDRKKKEAIDTRNSADSFVFQTEKALKDVGDKIDPGAKAGVESDLNALKSLLDSTKDQELSDSQVADIKAAQEKLMQSAQALFAKVYEQTQGAGQAGPDMGSGGTGSSGNPDDDIIDGDFREV